MTHLFCTIISIPFLTTGRRLFALRECLDVLRNLGENIIASLVEEAIVHDMKTMTLENAWERSKQSSTARGNALTLNRKITGVLGAICTALKSKIAVFEADNPTVDASERIIAVIFPGGVRPITSLAFEDKLAVSQSIVARFNGDLADDVAAAGIEAFVRRLELLTQNFADELRKPDTQETDFNALEAARTRGNLYIRQIIVKTMGEYNQVTEEDTERTKVVLRPLLEQVERVRQARRARRSLQEVDPTTGEEITRDTGEPVTLQPVETAESTAAVG